MKFNSLKPELYVTDFDKSFSFYKDVLGFKVEYTRENPRFAFLSYNGSQLMLQQEDNDEQWHNGKPEYPFGRGMNLEIDTNEIEKIINSLNSNNYPLKRGIKESVYMENDTKHKVREILVMDPDGYLLRFSEKQN
jgi:catechol 2,3-dioxygenase-like lactoylglutathione lyase family enzyme